MEKDGKTLKQKAISELREFLMISLYLWIFFAAFAEYKSIILREHQIDIAQRGVAIINALALGKILLIAKAFHPGARVDNAPLIYPTLLKSLIFALILGVFKIIEDVTIGYFHGKTIAESISDLAGGNLKSILLMDLILFVVLIPLIGFGELERVFGEGRIRHLFLRPRDTSQPYSHQIVSGSQAR